MNPPTPAPRPTEIAVRQRSRVLAVGFDDGASFEISFELLRVYSPSAEVQGHAPEQAVLQTGKRDVLVTAVEPVGHYAIQPSFSDGHDSGLYTWAYLYKLGAEHDELWARYLQRLADAGLDRDTPMGAGAAAAAAKPAGGCGGGQGGGCGCASR